jgi:hypothetical protein
MNSNIIPVGPSEIVTGAAAVTRECMLVSAEEDCVLTNVQFVHKPATAHVQATTSMTLKAGRWLAFVRSFDMTSGTVTLIYSGRGM